MRVIGSVAVTVAVAVVIACTSEPKLIPAADLVPPAHLAGTLKPVAGWMMKLGEFKKISGGTRAEAVYYNGAAVVSVEVTDSGLLARSFAKSYRDEAGGSQSRSITIGSTPGVESWNEKAKEGLVTLLVENRFVVSMAGRGINDISRLHDFASTLDTTGLAALRNYRT